MTKNMQTKFIVSKAVLILNLDRCRAGVRLTAASFISIKVKDFRVLLQMLSRVINRVDFPFSRFGKRG